MLLLTIGSSQVPGKIGMGTGFLLRGTGLMENAGPDFEMMKAKFPWMRRVLSVNIDSIEQTL